MKKLLLTCLCVMSLAFGLSGIASANSITNGGFETGDFTGWKARYYDDGVTNVRANVVTSSNGYSATDGTYFAELIANASLVQKNLSWNAGDKLTFDWNFLAFDLLPFNDRGIFKIKDMSNDLIHSDVLARVSDLPTFGDTGWLSYSHTFAAAGSGKIIFRAINGKGGETDIPFIQDYEYSSTLLVDNVNMEPVPEPATVALLGIGILGLAGAETRRRRNAKTKMIS